MVRIGLLGFPINDRTRQLCASLREREDLHIFSTDSEFSDSKEYRPDRLLDAIFSEKTSFCIVLFSNKYLDYLKNDQSNERTSLFNIINSRPNFIVPIVCEEEINFPTWLNLRFQKAALLSPDAFAGLIKEHLDEFREELRPAGYSDILELIRSTFGSSTKSVSDPVVSLAQRVGYELFLSENPLFRAKTFVLHLYSNIDPVATKAHFASNYAGIVANTHLSILLNPPPLEISKSAYLDTVRSVFSTNEITFIDDFIYGQVTESAKPKPQSVTPMTNHFIVPALREASAEVVENGVRFREASDEVVENGFRFLSDWLVTTSNSNNVLVLKGPGGVGKTTLARELARTISETSKRFAVYVDAQLLISAILNYPDIFSTFSLYSIFKLFARAQQIHDLGEEQFRRAFDSGRIPIIIDGLDEVIPRLPHGKTAAEFINSIARMFGGLNYGKVLITCRNKFWEDSSIQLGLRTLEVCPFTSKQIDEFLNARFGGDMVSARKVRKTLDELHVTVENGLLPYILELSARMVEQEPGHPIKMVDMADDIDQDFKNGPVDNIVYNLCKRETAKFDVSLGVADQFDCFIELALAHQGVLPEERLSQLISSATGQKHADVVTQTFRNHPLLAASGNVRFAFDFICEFFLALSVTRALNLRRNLRFEEIQFLSKDCRLGSNLLVAMASRCRELSDAALLQLTEMRNVVVKLYLDRDIDDTIFHDCIATLFNIGLQILIGARRANADHLTSYMKAFFATQEADIIRYVSIVNIDADRYPLRFSFEGCTVERAYIAGYSDFVRCSFDDKTKFTSSTIMALNMSERTRTTARRSNFSGDCLLDPSFAAILERQEQKVAKREQLALKQIQGFLRDFRVDGNFRIDRDESKIKSYYQGFSGISADKFLRMMVDLGVIVRVRDDQVRISENWIMDVEELLNQSMLSSRMASVIESVTQNIK